MTDPKPCLIPPSLLLSKLILFLTLILYTSIVKLLLNTYFQNLNMVGAVIRDIEFKKK